MRTRLAAVLITGLALSACGGSGDGAGDEAREHCEKQVAEQMKVPSSAEFLSSEVSEHDDDVHVIEGRMTATNEMGGTVEHDYRCTVRSTAAGPDATVTVTPLG